MQAHLATDRRGLLKNLAEKFLVYATGREIAFRDRDSITAIVIAAEQKGGGVRTLLHEVIASELFATR